MRPECLADREYLDVESGRSDGRVWADALKQMIPRDDFVCCLGQYRQDVEGSAPDGNGDTAEPQLTPLEVDFAVAGPVGRLTGRVGYGRTGFATCLVRRRHG